MVRMTRSCLVSWAGILQLLCVRVAPRGSLLLELKSVDQIHPIHEAQIISYLKLSKLEQGLLINFNVRLLKDGITSFLN